MQPVDMKLYRIFRRGLHLSEENAHELVQTLEEVLEVRTKKKNAHMLEIIQKDIQALREYTDQRFSSSEEKMDIRFAAFEEKMDVRFAAFEEKMDVRFVAFEEKMDTKFAALEGKMDTKIAALEGKMDVQFASANERFATKADLKEVKTDITKWMFIFWVGQAVTIAGVVISLLRK